MISYEKYGKEEKIPLQVDTFLLEIFYFICISAFKTKKSEFLIQQPLYSRSLCRSFRFWNEEAQV